MLIFAGVGTFDFANASAMMFSICDFFTTIKAKFVRGVPDGVSVKLFVAQLRG